MHSRPTRLHREILILTKGGVNGFKEGKKEKREWEERRERISISDQNLPIFTISVGRGMPLSGKMVNQCVQVFSVYSVSYSQHHNK